MTDVKFSDAKIIDLENILDKLENIYGDSINNSDKIPKIENSPTKVSLLHTASCLAQSQLVNRLSGNPFTSLNR